MNAIREISLKLQLGIDPASSVPLKDLRSMWSQANEDRFGSEWKARKDAPGLFNTAQMAANRKKA